jgi:hypothetical protein
MHSFDFAQLSCRFSISTIDDHREPCCRRARAWLHGVDANSSYRDGRWFPPTWLREKYNWGPLRWPLYWCSVPDAEVLDCGALAAVAQEVYRRRGMIAMPVQLILRYPQHVTNQWSAMWQRAGLSDNWISGEFCYHEACGALDGQTEILVWDSTANRWLDPPESPSESFASVAGIKLVEGASRASHTPRILHWRGIQLLAGVWHWLTFDERGCLTWTSADAAKS